MSLATKVALPLIFSNGTLKAVDRPDGKIVYEDSGKPPNYTGRTALVSPGMGDFRHQFRFLGPKLFDAGYRVIAPDLRGHGDSDTTFKTYTVEDVAADLTSILDAEQVSENVVLMGNSFSGAVILAVAAQDPKRFAGVVPICAFTRDMPGTSFMNGISVLIFNRLWGMPVWTTYFQSLFKAPPADLPAYVSAIRNSMMSDCSHAGIFGSFMRSSKNNAWELSAKVQSPVLLLMGEKDPDFSNPLEECETVKSHLTQAKSCGIVLIEGTGHYPHVEKPEETFAQIKSFLDSL
ncbi:Alpha/Beta hydrolase protein [Polychytrium aggregatum]|uniref:Alpha/Beta hydrolase protein n=1 Tax=Polychytrium aggregatum TaxID=110093 RepID=UPI0022FE96FA|nr:Alpha/Beta hydrolase protein [Polychytrium aggregatum]KAI9209931.1 Alpha/Beta hydrolase protein [Polychytrium aggregatum]